MSSARVLEYETAFQNLYQTRPGFSQASLQDIQNFYHATKNNSAFRPNMEEIIQFVEANPRKSSEGATLAGCIWFVYQSIELGVEIEKFIFQQKHRELSELSIPRLEYLYSTIREIVVVADKDPAQLKASLFELFKRLNEFYRELQRIMDKVEDKLNVPKAKMAAVTRTATYGCLAILAGLGIAIESPIRIDPVWWKRGTLSTLAFSCVFMITSVKEVYDLSNTAVLLDLLKRRIRLLRDNYIADTMLDIVEVS